MTDTLKVIKTHEDFELLMEYLRDKDFIAFDTETTGLGKESQIIGVSVSAEVHTAFYVVTAYWDVETKKLVELETNGYIPKLLRLLMTKNVICHNAPFDCWMVNNNYGIDLMPSIHTDTLILGHLLNENRRNGLKERGIELYGDNAATEQAAMKESVMRNGGVLTKKQFELYKGDCDLIGYYGAKDALLTLKLFYNDVPILYEEGLDRFFYEEESMPLLRGPTYDLNTTGLRVDHNKLNQLKAILTAECAEAHAFIEKEVNAFVLDKYPGTKNTNHFNIGAGQQLAWLLFDKLGNDYTSLTKAGRELCKALNIGVPYTVKARREFIQTIRDNEGRVWKEGYLNKKTGKKVLPKKFKTPWAYTACGKESLTKLADKYRWVKKLLEYRQNLKLLNTYVEGIQEGMQYNVIRPSFLQIGTTSGRYSSTKPNFQNLPREDKRVKACIIARAGKVFIGADQSQLEPRVFASFSGDERLLKCFEDGDDFYSTVGVGIFGKEECSLKKNASDSFARLYPDLREIAKKVPLAATYGANAFQLARITGKTMKEMDDILTTYFENFPSVKKLMLEAHEDAKNNGRVLNLFGRPRRMPQARAIKELYPNQPHSELPYEFRNVLNLAVNHRIQSTGASIMNRAAIAIWKTCKELAVNDNRWNDVKLVMQIHDEVVLEAPESISREVAVIIKYCLENTVVLPGVKLIADPKIATNLADLK